MRESEAELKAIEKGVGKEFRTFLWDRNRFTPYIENAVAEGVKQAFAEFLEKNKAEIIKQLSNETK
jgi:hypothetical protein